MKGLAWSLILLALLGAVAAVALALSGLWWHLIAAMLLGGFAFCSGVLLLFMQFSADVHEEYRAGFAGEK